MTLRPVFLRLSSMGLILILLFSLVPVRSVRAGGILFAMPVSSGGDCSSWANACSLRTALLAAVPGEEIWVAQGTHKPTPGSSRTSTFLLKSGVAIYGGFRGNETIRSQRNPDQYTTILSGDINGDDIDIEHMSENSFHVATSNGADSTAILDGFVISGGKAGDSTYPSSCPDDCGGGFLNLSGSPTLRNLTFINNNAGFYGGGLFVYASTGLTLANSYFIGNWAQRGGGMASGHDNSAEDIYFSLTDVLFYSNYAADEGGGSYCEYRTNPTLSRVTFLQNYAHDSGGGMFNSSNYPVLTDVTFDGNSSDYYGGGSYERGSIPILENVTFTGNSSNNGGGMFSSGVLNWGLQPTMTNVTFAGNHANEYGGYGGGMYNQSSNWVMTNVTFTGNIAGSRGGGIFHQDYGLTINNGLFWGNTSNDGPQIRGPAVVADSIIQGGCPEYATCINIHTADPKLGPLGEYGGYTETVPLLPGSSALDQGNDVTCSPFDQRGIQRPQGPHCDIGAYEYDVYPPYVTSITMADPSPTNAFIVNFTVTFSEPVLGLDPLDFSLTFSEIVAPSVLSVSGSGKVYTVQAVTGISGDGSLRLDVPASASITDMAGNPIAGLPYTSGETYSILNRVAYGTFLPAIRR